ncbi:MAG: hypothetical protein AB6733_05895 [Clostridiaceae bacterium]
MINNKEIMNNTLNIIDESVELIDELNKCFINYDINGGFKNLPTIIDNIQKIIDNVFLIKEEIGTFDINDINSKLNEIVVAIENEDYILIGDLFNYEIKPILDDIRNQIK